MPRRGKRPPDEAHAGNVDVYVKLLFGQRRERLQRVDQGRHLLRPPPVLHRPKAAVRQQRPRLQHAGGRFGRHLGVLQREQVPLQQPSIQAAHLQGLVFGGLVVASGQR